MNQITKDLATVPRGQWKVARVNGIVEVNLGRPTIEAVCKAIGADTIDTVNLREGGRPTGVVMMVDDTGLVDGKPANPSATALYHSVCRPGTTHPICGDVALVNDADFA
jgi:hypothetical protein